ncbi:hypothetical protein LR48_Vigan10g137400 [Vigna angularis]|uniref:Aminotransferase-like plant mobile domain-containing protein n=1 Tax=Phaseolus angularis TaxID=3914 RepID=A0A0L9VKS3_PHAAN|nr:hypothetical protein LR48_Vigan10g137400 [Vigna angularis]
MRAWMDTSYIVHMNSLIRSRHQTCIANTPFRWCLDILKPLEVSLKLIKAMVCRWVGHHQSFRVSQHLLPFTTVDVVMTLGIGIGGFEVPCDDSVVGKVGEMLNPKTTRLKDLMNMFDGMVLNDGIEVDVICRLYILVCLMVFYFPRKSRFVSNLPCLVLDDLDMLSEYDWGSAVHKYLVHSLNRCTKKILAGAIADSLSISGNAIVLQLEFDWYLSKHDLLDPLIRGAFHMDDGARPECCRPTAECDENEEKGRLGFEGNGDVEGSEEHAKPAVYDQPFGEVHEEHACKEQPLGEVDEERTGYEEAAGEVYEEPGSTKYEDPVGAIHEEPGVGKDAEAPGEADGRVGEEPLGEADSELLSAADCEPVSEADKEPLGVAHDHAVGVIDIVDDDEGDVNVQMVSVPPLRTYAGDPRTQVDLDKLYHSVFAKGIERRRRPGNQHMWQLKDYEPYFPSDLIELKDILSADLVSSGIRGRARIDKSMEELVGFRKKFVCDWILDIDNVRRFETLERFGLL